MPQPSRRIFSQSFENNHIDLQTFGVNSYHHGHKESYTEELHCLLLQPLRQPYFTRSREDIDACDMVIHSGLYIPDSVKSYPSQSAGLGNHCTSSSSTHLSHDMLPLKCAGKKTPS